MKDRLDSITIKGFKSFYDLVDFQLHDINVLIGANGAGKSNFIEFFRMIRAMMNMEIPELSNPSLTAFITNLGGMENVLFNGPKQTEHMSAELGFNNHADKYSFQIDMTAAADFLISWEKCYLSHSENHPTVILENGTKTPKILEEAQKTDFANCWKYTLDAIGNWEIYHFHDTSQFAKIRMPSKAYDTRQFHMNGANLATFLYVLKNGMYRFFRSKPSPSVDEQCQSSKDAYDDIVGAIQVIAPYFEDFILEPEKKGNEDIIKLQWKQKGSQLPMQTHHLSDGTLRFICLATALLQPEPPWLMLIDEPELGLHPEALNVLAEIIDLKRSKTQFILSTQSPAFADLFQPEDIITIRRQNGSSILERLDTEKLKGWLTEFSIGQLWRKNVIKGGVVNE